MALTGWMLGLLTGVAALNLMAWISTQARLYGLFSLFVACSALRWAAIDGLLPALLQTQDAGLVQRLGDTLQGAQAVTGSLCQIALLRLHERPAWLLRYYQGAGIGVGLLAMAAAWTPYFSAIAVPQMLNLLLAPLLSWGAYRALWRSNTLSGRGVAVVLPLHFFAMWPAVLGYLGWLEFAPWMLELVRWSVLPVVLLLHASIAWQSRQDQRERAAAQQQAALAQAEAERERRIRLEQQRFLGMVTHEIRTPIAVIDAAAHSLRLLDQMPQADPGERTRRYQHIAQAVARMGALMELTEAQERLHHEPGHGHSQALDLHALTLQALALQAPEQAARVRIHCAAHPTPPSTLPSTPPPACGDARLLLFALLNLLDNALKYAHPASPIAISIHPAQPPQQGWCWRIRDHGPGIAPDKQATVFDKFVRLDETQAQPGLGLGLALARQIAQRHGGSLQLQPQWTQGASFLLYLPSAASGSAPPPHHPHPPHPP